MKTEIYMVRQPRICLLGLTLAIFCYCMLYFNFGVFEGITFFHNTDKPIQINPTSVSKIPDVDKSVFPFLKVERSADNKTDPCGGRYIYIHNLPSRFNEDMVKECCTTDKQFDLCEFSTNNGLGPVLKDDDGVFTGDGWYATNQFTLDIIFSSRMKQYECLTNESSLASAIFVPFYAGLDATRYNWGYNISVRDAASVELVDWLQKRDEWKYMNGKDHFLVGGRTTWDFRRSTDEDTDYGTKLLLLPAVKNMSLLFLESSPWNSNEFAVPYASYFHPSKDVQVFHWQDRMRTTDRKWLFCFGGAPRPGIRNSIRSLLIDQCKNSGVAKLLDCGVVAKKCHSPSSIMKMFQSSVFCLQPQGDSFTRRSAFDSILAGCIPVFFHPNSFYAQYTRYLPKNYTSYSVFIPEADIRKNVSIEQRLSQIDPQRIKMMRNEVINLIPRLMYADPRYRLETLKDAFDVSVEAIINKVTKLRQDMIDGHVNDDFADELITSKLELLKEGE